MKILQFGFLVKATAASMATVITLHASGNGCLAQDLRKPMEKAFQAFQSLLPLMYDDKSFADPRNQKEISRLMTSLRENFHNIKDVPERYVKMPGFASNVQVLTETLDDASVRFTEGHKQYASWRLRQIGQNCVSCHVTYNVTVRYQPSAHPKLDSLSDAQKGEFFLATRQVENAESALLRAVKSDDKKVLPIVSLRRLLMLYVRIKKDPANGAIKIRELSQSVHLPESDLAEVQSWIESLNSWAKEDRQMGTLAEVRSSLTSAVNTGDMLYSRIDAVGVLRATAAIHALLEKGDVSAEDRAEMLYLLGFGYAKLQPYFVDDFPELYLRQCIDEFPGSQPAKRAYKLYEDTIMLGFTGSAGTSLPTEVRVKLMELHNKAYALPNPEVARK